MEYGLLQLPLRRLKSSQAVENGNLSKSTKEKKFYDKLKQNIYLGRKKLWQKLPYL